jgi:hypothetical protein
MEDIERLWGKGDILMVDKEAQAIADRFMEKLAGKGFVMSRSQNNGDNYTKTKQKRDSHAVIEFSKTETAKYIMNLS